MTDPGREYEEALKTLAEWLRFLEREREHLRHQIERVRRSGSGKNRVAEGTEGVEMRSTNG